MTNFWDERYASEEYIYGTEPNDFLRAEAHRIPPGRVLCLADGEGRNSVYLATLGYDVTAVDLSIEGLRKAERLAEQKGVKITTIHADLATFDLWRDTWSGVVEIFVHLPPGVRHHVHSQIPAALQIGGCVITETYRPEQLALGTGGPDKAELMNTLEGLLEDYAALEIAVAQNADREVWEGTFHGGMSATVQVVGIRRE